MSLQKKAAASRKRAFSCLGFFNADNYKCTEKNYSRGVERGICGGAGCAHTPTYTGPLLAVDLFFRGVIYVLTKYYVVHIICT